MEMTTFQKLQTYIKAEIGDSALYNELARIAPDNSSAKLLREFASDEYSHAEEFSRIYKRMTGKTYFPEPEPVVFNMPYREILLDRILDESGDFRKYREQYNSTFGNTQLKNAYFRAGTDENVHALRLLYLIDK